VRRAGAGRSVAGRPAKRRATVGNRRFFTYHAAMPRSLYLIDGHAQIYRAYYAPFGQLTSPTGEPTRATHVFWQMIINLLKTRKPDHLALVLDVADETTFRKQIYADYKAHRDPPPEDMDVQIRRIIEIAEAVRMPILRLPGYEADDILATLAAKHGGPDLHVYFVSRDKDLEQLLSDHVTLYDPLKDEEITPARLKELKGWTPEQAVEAQCLIGDSVDNIPGVPGIGPKTAAKLIEKYGTAAGVIAHAAELTPKQRESVLAFAPHLERTRQLVTLSRDVPVTLDLEAARTDVIAWHAARPIFRMLGFRKLQEQLPGGGDADVPDAAASGQSNLDRGASAATVVGPRPDGMLFDVRPTPHDPDRQRPATDAGGPSASAEGANSAEAPAGGGTAPIPHRESPGRGAYRCVNTPEGLAALADILKSRPAFALDTETSGLQGMDADLVGIAVAWGPGEAAYIPVRCVFGGAAALEDVQRILGPIFADNSTLKIGHNLKYDMLVLRNHGLEVGGPLFDTMIAAFCAEPMRMTFGLDRLALDVFGHEMIPITDLIGKGRDQLRMDQVQLAHVVEYAGEDADFTWRLYEHFAPALGRAGVEELFRETEMPLVRVLLDMEYAGVRIDADFLARMNSDLGKRIAELADAVQQSAGVRFNIDSPKQLAEVLFDKLGMRVVRRTKTARSTDAETLETLANETGHPALQQILEYRELQKLRSTYIEALPAAVSRKTGRVHTHYHQTGAITGRLSSSDPNLQNIPIRTQIGREIRRAFVPRTPAERFIVADYSQIELRILADFSGDEALRQAFAEDRDIHAVVAAQVNGIPLEQVTPELRSRAKAVNFGIVYGQTAFGLARTTGMSRSEAQAFIDEYFARYARIRAFLNQCIETAKRDGYVRTILGRRRPIMDISSRNQTARAQAERLAVNTVIQGSAADLIKVAMIRLHRRIAAEKLPLRMLLQVHDELVLETPATEVAAMCDVVRTEMSGAMKLSIPLKVDVGVGQSWLEAK
jgi:DNA polymerase-1